MGEKGEKMAKKGRKTRFFRGCVASEKATDGLGTGSALLGENLPEVLQIFLQQLGGV